MYLRLLSILRCPECNEALELLTLSSTASNGSDEISEGLLYCTHNHWYPIAGGIPRMLPGAISEYWEHLKSFIPNPAPQPIHSMMAVLESNNGNHHYDFRTRENFSREWENHELGENTWGIELKDRVNWYFLEPIHIPLDTLRNKMVLDAGCGNGSQSVAYTEYGVEVVALDLSSGLELGNAFRLLHPKANPSKVHFVQGDLQQPPFAPGCFDIIHSAGVLHHTPNTKDTFNTLVPLLRAEGTFYMWVYKYEPYVTPIINMIRFLTTNLPTPVLVKLAKMMAVPFKLFCATVSALGLRYYPNLSNKEAVLALMDIFGAPYAHYHSFEEISEWYKNRGFGEIWSCNYSRRGFGVCGRLAVKPDREDTGNRLCKD
jgi:uncharacterized protein YbaR (Trm112 family)/SAM-dependent methyltransferase